MRPRSREAASLTGTFQVWLIYRTHSTRLHLCLIQRTFMVGIFKVYWHSTRHFQTVISLIARNTSCMMCGQISRVYFKIITALGNVSHLGTVDVKLEEARTLYGLRWRAGQVMKPPISDVVKTLLFGMSQNWLFWIMTRCADQNKNNVSMLSHRNLVQLSQNYVRSVRERSTRLQLDHSLKTFESLERKNVNNDTHLKWLALRFSNVIEF